MGAVLHQPAREARMIAAHLNNLAFARMHAAAIPVGLDSDVVPLMGVLIVLAVLYAFFGR